MSAWFIAGAGTDVGKTYVTVQLIRQARAAGLRVQALKPVSSGVCALEDPQFAQSDTAALLQASGLAITAKTVEACSPWRFSAPLSPDMAAAAEGRRLPFGHVLQWCRSRIAAAPADAMTFIEGAGGIMSPIAEDALNLHLIKALACPIVLIGGSYLGGISHMLTALETLKAHGAKVERVILNETAGSTVDFEATIATLNRFAQDANVTPLRQHGCLPACQL